MSTEQQMQQSLADLPTWLLILVALAGLTGEMWRADAAGMAVGVLIKRVLLRFGASAMFGIATVLFPRPGVRAFRLLLPWVAWSRASVPMLPAACMRGGWPRRRACVRCLGLAQVIADAGRTSLGVHGAALPPPR